MDVDHLGAEESRLVDLIDCRSFWSTCLNSDHALVCANPILCFNNQQIHCTKRIGVSKMTVYSFATKYQTNLSYGLAIDPPEFTDEY